MTPFYLALILFAAALGGAQAQGGCTKRPVSETQPLIKSFMIRPESLIERFPDGGIALSGTIRELVSADAQTTLDPVLKLLRSANGAQTRAIGAALGTAAHACMVGSQAAIGQKLMGAVREQNNPELTTSFFKAFSETVSTPRIPTKPNEQRKMNPLGRPYIGDPATDPFRLYIAPDPHARIR
jgi:hypothetical protein